MDARSSSSTVSALSRPIGAHTSTRSGSMSGVAMSQRPDLADVLRYAGQHSLEVRQRRADPYLIGTDLQLPNRGLVPARALLHDGHRTSHVSARFEEPQEDDG